MAVPIIRELKKWKPVSLRAQAPLAPARSAGEQSLSIEEIASGKIAPRNDTIEVRDAPPGASCPVVETIRGADFVLMVTEPTPFGLHDLKQVVEITSELGLPAGVVINRDGIGDNAVQAYCEDNDLPILMRIPMERRIAEAIASGVTLIRAFPEYRPAFHALLEGIHAGVRA
jgi:MinD superfamily P-loop ATPase